MSGLSAADIERMRDTVEVCSLDQTCDIYRNPAASGGKTAALAASSSNVACEIVPASDQVRMTAPAPEIVGGRIDSVGYFLNDVNLSVGDEVRQSGIKYKVLGLGRWSTLRSASLQRLEA